MNEDSGWVRSSKCDSSACIEVRLEAEGNLVRIRTTTAGGWDRLVTRTEWEAFVAGVKAGEFDL